MLKVHQMAMGFLGLCGCAVGERIVISHDGERRNFYLYVPDSAGSDAPVVLALHGGGPGRSKGRRLGAFTGLDELADTEGFVAVFPSSLRGNWNDGRDFALDSVTNDLNDVGFLLAVLDEVQQRAEVDLNRVVVTGISNGGFMTQRMLCEHADRFVAGISVIATMPAPLSCESDVPVPVRFVLGTEDSLVQYQGGEVGSGDRGESLSADAAVEYWAGRNGCGSEVIQSELPDLDPNDGSNVLILEFQDCLAPVSLVTLVGAGHTWPGGSRSLAKRIIGEVNRDVDGEQLVWEFGEPFTR